MDHLDANSQCEDDTFIQSTMKIHLLFYLIHSIVATAAFVVRAPTTPPVKQLQSSSADRADSPSFDAKARIGGPQRAPPSGALSNSEPPSPTKQKQPPMSPARIWDTYPLVRVEGNSLRTWDVHRSMDAMQVLMKTEGRPLNAKVELWHGPVRIHVFLLLYYGVLLAVVVYCLIRLHDGFAASPTCLSSCACADSMTTIA